MEEFAGKIRAAKDSQTDPDFCVVARIEALIAGLGLDEALARAEQYRGAGADAVLIHSKESTADQIVDFMVKWEGRSSVVIVPTTYAQTPTSLFEDIGVSVVIWANHVMRACITAMQQTAAAIHEGRSVADMEDRIATVKEIFRLQDAEELTRAERSYLPAP